MSLHLLKVFELDFNEFLFVVRCKEIHVLVSVGSPLLFGSLRDAFDLFLLLSFAFINLLYSLFCNKSWISVGYNEILRIQLRKIGTRRDNLSEFARSDL